jgi:hypothetical protein
MGDKSETGAAKSEGKSEQAPGQQKVITVPNVNDATAAPWVGTKAEYKANRESLPAQGFVRADDTDDTDDAASEPDGGQ